jgi:CheY-like chemotaxis protein
MPGVWNGIISMIKKKVMIIDDEKYIRDAFTIVLRTFSNVQVITVADGQEGYEMAKLSQPDLIILDNKMPGIPGEQVARMLRADPVTKNIPIILATGMRLDQNEINLIKLDVNEYLQKPINPLELKRVIEDYLGDLE